MIETVVLRRALAQLVSSRRLMLRNEGAGEEELRDVLRAGVIQAFEYTYELAFAALRRYARETASADQAVAQQSFNEIVRSAFKGEMIRGELADWMSFRELRNLTSHTYNDDSARHVIDALPEFIAEIEYLASSLDAFNGRTSQDGNANA